MIKSILAIALALFLVTGSCSKLPRIVPPASPVSIQQKASHGIILYTDDEGESEDGICTVTVVGPHALMTAEHCWTKKNKSLRIDLSRRLYKAKVIAKDDREHVILGVDGPEFHNYIDLTSSIRPTIRYEHVYMYGVGGAEYPPRLLSGYHVPDFDANSEVDQGDKIQRYSLAVVPGDSGSAIYGDDGKIVALITYHKDKDGVGFELNFTPDQVKDSLSFNGSVAAEKPLFPVVNLDSFFRGK